MEIPIQDKSKLPGFDVLRLLGSLSILFSHSYLIALDSEASEPFQMLFKGDKNIIGLYGLFMSVIISGFLLSRALHRNSDFSRFVINRAMRLLPGFICCILFTALIIAPLCSAGGPAAYFASGHWLVYIKQSLTTLNDAHLPNIFNYTSSTSQVVNGSLWSLSIVVFYSGLLLGLWMLFPFPGLVVLVLGVLGASVLINPAIFQWLPVSTYLLPYFSAGIVVWWLTQHLGMSRAIAHLCCSGIAAGFLLGFPHQAFLFFGAYLVIFLGSRPFLIDFRIARIGHLSYGIFLLGWPIQQALRHWLDLRQPLLMFAISAIVTGVMAWAMYRWVERPALALRKPLLQWLSGASM
jgi:peptidoglycan/LPS O-acetylase OafA/YrhL